MVYDFVRALPGVHDLLVTVACGSSSADLAPAQGCQDHTSSPSALRRSPRVAPRPSHPASYVRDDGDTPLWWRRDSSGFAIDSVFPQWRESATHWHDGQCKVWGRDVAQHDKCTVISRHLSFARACATRRQRKRTRRAPAAAGAGSDNTETVPETARTNRRAR